MEDRNPNYVYPKRVITASIFGIPLMCAACLVVEACERWGFYGGAAVNGVYIPQMLKFSTAEQQIYNNLLNFWSYGTALLGAYIADCYLGKVKTIAVFAAVYVIGLLLQALSSMPFVYEDFPNDPTSTSINMFWCTIVFVGLGTGGIKANVGPLLSEQIPNPDARKTEMVFRYFYWAINLGAIGAYVIAPLLHRFDKDEDHPQGTTYYYSMWTTFAAFIVGIIVFYSFMPFYITSKVTGSPIARWVKCYVSAFSNRHKPAVSIDDEEHFLYKAEGYTQQELKDYRRLISVMGLLVHYPTFWYLYGQNSNYVTTMGTFMKMPSGLTADQLGLVDPLAIVILIPIFDRAIFPFLRKVCGLELNIITRIAIGYIFMALAGFGMVAEMLWLKANGHWNDEGNTYFPDDIEKNISVLWTIPLFALCAIGEIFASVTLNEFTYSQAPTSLKSVVFGLGTFTNCFSSIMGLIMSPFQTPQNLSWFWIVFSGIAVIQAFIIPYQFRNYTIRDTKEDMAHSTDHEIESSVAQMVTDNVKGISTLDKKATV
eukprot:Nk52_evm32s307 gene=Nk52_evmTU32s307